MNKVILMGRLTRDPEIRYSQSAEPLAITRYSLAVNRQFKRDGEPDADFINVVAFGKRGEFASKYFKKGQMVAVVGQLRINSYEDQNGQKKWSTDVVVDEQHFAESRASFESRTGNMGGGMMPQGSPAMGTPTPQPAAPAQNQPATPAPAEGFYPINEDLDDDLPF